MIKTLLLGCVLAIVICGKAQAFTGNDLLNDCAQNGPKFSQGWCLGYISGVADQWVWDMIFKYDQKYQKCRSIPNEVTYEQIKDIVVRYLMDKPAVRHQGARDLIVRSLWETWPCL